MVCSTGRHWKILCSSLMCMRLLSELLPELCTRTFSFYPPVVIYHKFIQIPYQLCPARLPIIVSFVKKWYFFLIHCPQRLLQKSFQSSSRCPAELIFLFVRSCLTDFPFAQSPHRSLWRYSPWSEPAVGAWILPAHGLLMTCWPLLPC